MRQATSFCRICNAHCGTILTIDDDNHVVSIRGDKDQPMSRGYACFKGLQVEESHHGPARLLRPLARQKDGSFKEIASETALDEIANALRRIVDRHGPEAVALFSGNGGIPNSSGFPMARAFMAALGSDSLFSTLTIDQSAKVVAFERLGAWGAGLQDMEQSEVLLFFGSNPLVSHSTVPVMGPDPVRRMKAAKARGMRLIVVDPRQTETAHFADLFLQPVPGQDPAILAGLLRLIFAEGWEDRAFCDAHVGAERMAALREAVAPFTPEMVENRAGLEPGQLAAAARLFARDNRTGAAYAATGPCMAPFSNLTQHLVEVLNVVCGRLRRAGDSVIVDLVSPDAEIRAEVFPPPRSWLNQKPGRIRGVRKLNGERLTGALAEEITTPGEGQIRAMIVGGANPANSVPDQARMVEALKSLDLLVVVDPYMTPTAELAHYVMAPRMQYERADLPLLIPGYPLYPDNWLQFTPPVLALPHGSDLVEDWYVFWSLGKRLGLSLDYNGMPLDMDKAPTTEQLLAMRLVGTRVSFEELIKHPSGLIRPRETYQVAPGRAEATGKFDVMPEDVAEELAAYSRLGRPEGDGAGFTHLLSTRRLRDTFNSNGTQLRSVRKRTRFNPAHMHPEDLTRLGVSSGDRIAITSDRGRIEAIAQADPSVRLGVVSMAHGWGRLPGKPSDEGDCVNLLVDSTRDVEDINAMPRMSAIPVNIAAI